MAPARSRYDDIGPPPRPPPAVQSAMYQFGGRDHERNTPRRHEFSFRSRPMPRGASERDLLRHPHTAAERAMLGENYGGSRFRNVDEMSDSEEESMDLELSDLEEEEERSRGNKRLKVDGADAAPVAKWSNPDVYSSLPPPADVTGRGFDVIRLIRKARDESKAQTQSPAENADDFISFEPGQDDEIFAPPVNAPAGPRADRHDDRPVRLGKRKRELDETPLLGRPDGRHFHADGMVLAEWRIKDAVHPTPWIQKCTATDLPAVALHKEIIDFYNWVKPQEFEFDVRQDVIDRLSRELNRLERGEVKAFGSYAAGMYLPIADMDLVYNVRRLRHMMNKPIDKRLLFTVRNFLERQKLARPGSIKVISGAKVPIIKFIDQISGLKVDLSFNNDSGIQAITTFDKWRREYPAMPVIVAIVKQFLMIRGLNDVSVGGLGGFSTICLVTSILQHLPVNKHQNLGEVLVEFFNVYGNLLDRIHVAIRMNPPSYVDKRDYQHLKIGNDKPERLAIIDPNRADNNISGGSSEVSRIFATFSKAHQILQDKMQQFGDLDDLPDDFSFLKELVGGDFSSYDSQRQILRSIYNNTHALPAPAIIPPPPPPITSDPIPPPPPSPPPNKSLFERVPKSDQDVDRDTTSVDELPSKPKQKGERRLQRLKDLCPELAPRLTNKSRISVADALKVGGWSSTDAMSHDLDCRQRALTQKGAATAKAT